MESDEVSSFLLVLIIFARFRVRGDCEISSIDLKTLRSFEDQSP